MSPLDPARVAAARRLAAAATGSPGVQHLTELAARLLAAPGAGVSVVGAVQTVTGSTGWGRGTVGAELPLTESLGALAVAAGEPLVICDARTDPRFAGSPSVQDGDIVSYLGVPLVDGAGELVVGVLAVFGPEPRAWTDADVALLGELARPVATELEFSAVAGEFESSKLRWGLAIDAAGIGSFDWDLVTGALSWDDRMAQLFGHQRAELSGTVADFTARVHPDDSARVAEALRAAIATCGAFDAEYRVQLPGGGTRWLQSRGRVLCDDGGVAARFLGAAYDTTDQRHSETRVARVLESMPAAFFSLGRDWSFTYVNAEAERLLDRSRDELLGADLWEQFPPAVGSLFESQYREAMASAQPTVFQAYYPPPLDSWYEVRVWPSPDGLSVYFLEVTERRQAEERARRTAERLALIAEVTAAFSSSLDGERNLVEALGPLARVVVPVLGDWVIVSVVEEDGRLRDVTSWHWDPELRDVVARYAELRLAALSSTAPIVAALDTGEVMTVDDVGAAVGRTLPPGEVSDCFWRLAPRTAVALPLLARGRTVGAMSVYRSADRPAADAQDVATVRELADRAALALDNRRLYEQQRRMAEELQRSLLTEPVQPETAQIAVRYSPAVRAAHVGGDWYDAFGQPDGATMLVIGDVVGHDTVAAAAMGQLRGLLRGIAFRGGAGPAEVLGDLDRAMQGLAVHTLATAAIARFEQTAAERLAGLTRLRWSSAGHPPLMMRDPDGAVSVLGGEPLEDLCGGLLERLRPGTSEDDVALVAIHLR